MNMDGFSLCALAAELNHKLTGGRIDKIFQSDSYELSVLIRQPGENIRLMISANPERPAMLITQENLANPAVPPVFCMLLRKHLEDGRISGVRQLGRDRILIVEVDTRGERGHIETKQLVAELIGKHSNIIFLQNELIIDAMRRVGPAQSRYRHILPSRTYIAPPGGNRLDPLTASPEAIAAGIRQATGPLSKALISVLEGVGPVSVREFVFRAGLSADMNVTELTAGQISKLLTVICEIAGDLKQGHYQSTVVVGETNRLLAMAAFPLHHLTDGQPQHFATMSEAIAFADQLKGIRQPQAKQNLARLISAEISKLEKKINILKLEREEAASADDYRQKGDILMAHLYQLSPGETQISLPDIYADQAQPSMITISLDPYKSPIQNANSYYQKYSKLKRAQLSLDGQLAQAAEDLLYLESLQVSLENVQDPENVNEIRQELGAAGYLRLPAKKGVSKHPLSAPYVYKLSGGFTALVGKNNRQNDLLTMKQAHADDFWFHTKDIPGSHVILRIEGQQPDAAIITEAARLAAYYSKARQSSNVPVDYTRRRYVKKPAGAKPGFVIYDHHSTLYVTPPSAEELANMIE